MRPAEYPELGPLTPDSTEEITRAFIEGTLRSDGYVAASVPHSENHIQCPACEELRLTILTPGSFSLLCFRDAAPIWLEDRRDRIAPRTHVGYLEYLKPLGKFFDLLILQDIHIGHVMAYQQERSKDAGAARVNHEVNCLKQVLERAQLWPNLVRFYKPLRNRQKARVGRALTEEEEQRILEVAASNPRWKIAFWCSLLTMTTTAGPGEITHLHLNDVQLGGDQPSIRIRFEHLQYGKNLHRDRVVPLNDAARWSVAQIMKRYYRICQRLKIAPCGDHYILPGRGRRTGFDPWKPMGSWKKAWQKLREAAGLLDLRIYDWRHHAFTKLLELPEVSDQTIEEIGGHATERQKKTYGHVRLKRKQEAVAKLDVKVPRPKPRLVQSILFDRPEEPWEREVPDVPEQRSVDGVQKASAKGGKAKTGAGS